MLEVRKGLSAQMAEASSSTSTLTAGVVPLEGRARELALGSLRAEAVRLDDAEGRLPGLEDDAFDLEALGGAEPIAERRWAHWPSTGCRLSSGRRDTRASAPAGADRLLGSSRL